MKSRQGRDTGEEGGGIELLIVKFSLIEFEQKLGSRGSMTGHLRFVSE